ncbi:hypothetical protein DRF59_11490 [Chryseobacterium flavum]|uniref:Carboxypeptidase-like regulatory domain-containing protein n=1 Tax=Chryseobacterium flavum TaxID=415851 RepID=A0A3D9CL29_9FLAO|nr:hypothetical protein [Chryseobacterium flavum]REC66451.1 hypothetical protein DRF59_11490 [Chryseobacterium flavum]
MKIFNLFFLLFLNILYSQAIWKVKVVDEQEGTPIPNARILFSSEVLYTNDDGEVLIPENKNVNMIDITKSGYISEKLTTGTSLLKMKPLYKQLEEVKIINVDIKKIFEEVSKKYTKLYYSAPSLYDIVYKQKNTDNGGLSFLLIAEASLWTSSNFYSFKYKNDYDQFVQMELNDIKYFKSTENKNDFFKGSSLDQSKDFVGNIFFNYELIRVLGFLSVKDVKLSGRLTNDTDHEQLIHFKIHAPLAGVNISGSILYNKVDHIITRYEANYDQSELPYYKNKTDNGIDYEFKPGNGTVIFEFYKKDNKYIPSLSEIKGESYVLYEGKKNVKTFNREIIFQRFNETKTGGLQNKIDLNKKLWENIPNDKNKDSNVLLSKDEQRFIEQKND